MLRIAEGNAFQRSTAADWNARSPRVARVLMPGNSRNIDSFDLTEYLDCFLIVTKSIKWLGAWPYKHLKKSKVES